MVFQKFEWFICRQASQIMQKLIPKRAYKGVLSRALRHQYTRRHFANNQAPAKASLFLIHISQEIPRRASPSRHGVCLIAFETHLIRQQAATLLFPMVYMNLLVEVREEFIFFQWMNNSIFARSGIRFTLISLPRKTASRILYFVTFSINKFCDFFCLAFSENSRKFS